MSVSSVRIGAVALSTVPLDVRGNLERIRASLAEARERGVRVIVLPELALTGYGCEDGFHAPATEERAWSALESLLPDTAGLVVAVGLPLRILGALFNAAALVVDGKIAGLVPKQHLAGDGVHYEPRWFRAWTPGERTVITRGDLEVPVGDLLFDVGGVRIGFEICEDAWAAERPGARLASRGVDLILNPSASHFAFGKDAVRRRFVLEGSRAFGVAYAYANLLGNEAGRVLYDGHTLIAAENRLLAEGRRFSFGDHELAIATVDLRTLRAARSRVFSLKVDPAGEDGVIRSAWPENASGSVEAAGAAEVREQLPDDLESFTRIVARALFDHARRARARGFVVSASGGADSSAVMALVACAVTFGVEEQGLAFVAERLGHPDAPDLDTLRERVLTTAYLGTRNSTETTRRVAADLARALGARHHEFDVDDLVAGTTARVESALERPLTWEEDDLALQNVQARVRAPLVWMLANVESKLLLTTSNRSEAAVGYATMDGDTCGGLAPIAGIDKAFLREWLRWMAGRDLLGSEVASVLGRVAGLAPTAELRPTDATQTDEDDLMPYPVLDAIEELAIGRKLAPRRTLEELGALFPQSDPMRRREWVHRFYTLWSRNQWKRERYAPAFHLDDRNLDPKTWCRWPILSDGFAEQLEDLMKEVD